MSLQICTDSLHNLIVAGHDKRFKPAGNQERVGNQIFRAIPRSATKEQVLVTGDVCFMPTRLNFLFVSRFLLDYTATPFCCAGPIPEALGALTKLAELDLGDNQSGFWVAVGGFSHYVGEPCASLDSRSPLGCRVLVAGRQPLGHRALWFASPTMFSLRNRGPRQSRG